MRRPTIWKLSHFELHRNALRISYLSFASWWLKQQDNNNNNQGVTNPASTPLTKKKKLIQIIRIQYISQQENTKDSSRGHRD